MNFFLIRLGEALDDAQRGQVLGPCERAWLYRQDMYQSDELGVAKNLSLILR